MGLRQFSYLNFTFGFQTFHPKKLIFEMAREKKLSGELSELSGEQ